MVRGYCGGRIWLAETALPQSSMLVEPHGVSWELMHPVYPAGLSDFGAARSKILPRYSSPHLSDGRLLSHRLPAGISSSANVSNTEHRSRDIPEPFYGLTAYSWMPYLSNRARKGLTVFEEPIGNCSDQ
jgi:hypothetical protein